MKKFYWMPIWGLAMALGLGSCSADDEEMVSLLEQQTTVTSSFSLLSYSQSECTPVLKDGSNSEGMDEKLVCKILSDGRLLLTHKNVVFDDGTDIKLETSLVGNQLCVSESGVYGQSGIYAYYTLTATVGILMDGDYTIVVKRNGNLRAEFKMTYDSSKAK